MLKTKKFKKARHLKKNKQKLFVVEDLQTKKKPLVCLCCLVCKDLKTTSCYECSQGHTVIGASLYLCYVTWFVEAAAALAGLFYLTPASHQPFKATVTPPFLSFKIKSYPKEYTDF